MMTDNRTTELLPCPMCGVAWPSVQVRWIGFTHTHNGAFSAGYRGECCDCGLTTRAFNDEAKAIAAWNKRAELGSEINGDTSDGYHTFNELYHHRAVLFSVIVRDHRDLAWKARKHYDGTMYDGMFIVGIDTPWGQASYHYDLDPYWDMFDCKEREAAPEWDGHTPDDAIERIGKLAALGGGECENISYPPEGFLCSACGWGDFAEPSHLLTTAKFTGNEHGPNFCPNCGKAVKR